MSYPRRTKAKNYTHSQQSPGPASTTVFTSATIPHSQSGPSLFTTAPYYPSATTITNTHTLRKRTFSSGQSSRAQNQTRKRASSATAASFSTNRPFLFTPSTPPIVGPRNATTTALGPPPPYTPFPPLTTKPRSRSSSHLSQNISTATFLAQYSPPHMRFTRGASSDGESEPDPLDEDDESNMIYTAKQQPGHGVPVRSRSFPRHSKGITTAHGQLGAGETETEADEPVRIYTHHVPDRIFNLFHHPAEAFTNCADSASFRSSGTAEHSGASYHPAFVRSISPSLHRTSSMRGDIQPVQGVACTHKWKTRCH
jgi:hypothetical protein